MLVLQNVSKRYGDVVALDGATFEVARARIIGFLGPNGAGKTTAMRCIFGLTEPDAGSIEWDGRPVTPDDRARFGYMPEERGLYPKMQVREQLTYFARLSGANSRDADAAADRWLRRFGLAGRGRAKVEELSHGNQQRLQLAVTLVHDPDLRAIRCARRDGGETEPSRRSRAVTGRADPLLMGKVVGIGALGLAQIVILGGSAWFALSLVDLVVVASLVPLWSPMVMPTRSAVGSVPAWQLGLAVTLVVVFSYLVIRAAARVYRWAVLRLGAKVRLRDAWHMTT